MLCAVWPWVFLGVGEMAGAHFNLMLLLLSATWEKMDFVSFNDKLKLGN